jgi:hypothetical protein
MAKVWTGVAVSDGKAGVVGLPDKKWEKSSLLSSSARGRANPDVGQNCSSFCSPTGCGSYDIHHTYIYHHMTVIMVGPVPITFE